MTFKLITWGLNVRNAHGSAISGHVFDFGLMNYCFVNCTSINQLLDILKVPSSNPRRGQDVFTEVSIVSVSSWQMPVHCTAVCLPVLATLNSCHRTLHSYLALVLRFWSQSIVHPFAATAVWTCQTREHRDTMGTGLYSQLRVCQVVHVAAEKETVCVLRCAHALLSFRPSQLKQKWCLTAAE